MNYHHAYHAGHSADVFKHFVLYTLLKQLTEKDKPLSYIDTHAAYAFYQLNDIKSQKTQAYQDGISRLWEQASISPHLLPFLNLIKTLKSQENEPIPQYYPGSAWIAHQLLRKDDKLFLSDLNPDATAHLKANFRTDPSTQVAHQDGFMQLNAWLPPKPARGLVFIDPPYEKSDDWDRIVKTCSQCLARWSIGTIVIWYPIKSDSQIKRFYNNLSKLDCKSILAIEFCPLASDVSQRLNGSGMIVINPPWKFESKLSPALQDLLRLYDEKNAYTDCHFLKNS